MFLFQVKSRWGSENDGSQGDRFVEFSHRGKWEKIAESQPMLASSVVVVSGTRVSSLPAMIRLREKMNVAWSCLLRV